MKGSFSRGATFFVGVAWGIAGQAALGQCPAIDFENLPVNTVVTNQYGGVTFSAPDTPGSCDGVAYIRDMTTLGGASSPYRAVSTRAGGGCDFSPEHLRLVFGNAQARVTFTLGPYCGNYSIIAYDHPSSGAVVFNQTVSIAGCTNLHGVHRLVHVTTATPAIRRIEIDGGQGAAESIDDLVFGVDQTVPAVEITSPPARSCVCDHFEVFGNATDPDGIYLGDILEARGEDAESWVPAMLRFGPATGLLYEVNAMSAPGGWYFLRVTGMNACGLTASDTTSVFVDKFPPYIDIRSPRMGAIVGGVVCVDGSVHESHGTVNACLDHFTVDYAAGINYMPVDPVQPVYSGPVVNDPMAAWNTRAGIVDGEYDLRVRAYDVCGQEAVEGVHVTVDNTRPIAVILEPLACGAVEGLVPVYGTVLDAFLDRWVLEYSGDGGQGWQEIASRGTGVNSNLLGYWDTSGLTPCAYMLRLRAWDYSVLDCNGTSRNTTEYTVSVNVGMCADFDVDNDGDVDLGDFREFEDSFTGPS